LLCPTGIGALPVKNEVKAEAKRRTVELFLPASEAIGILKRAETAKTNVILHVSLASCQRSQFVTPIQGLVRIEALPSMFVIILYIVFGLARATHCRPAKARRPSA
jgi:hypothetical protein